jgi:hypothetical protein
MGKKYIVYLYEIDKFAYAVSSKIQNYLEHREEHINQMMKKSIYEKLMHAVRLADCEVLINPSSRVLWKHDVDLADSSSESSTYTPTKLFPLKAKELNTDTVKEREILIDANKRLNLLSYLLCVS